MKINTIELEKPIIQGGMGVGVSMGNLAGAVAKNGGMGVISTANIGFQKKDFLKNSLRASEESLAFEIKKAKEISKGNGLIAINAMVATVQYKEMIKAAVKNGIDCVISGAGVPLYLPEYVAGTEVLIAPIVSSGKSTKAVLRFWDKKYERTADFIVIEGATAGGHLGFSYEDIIENKAQTVEVILQEVKNTIKPFEEKYKRKIPIFVAGSLNTREKVESIMKSGADGVQVATRFITTKECDATIDYKRKYVEASNKDIVIIKSPVGMPGRALRTPLIEKIEKGKVRPKFCINCIHTCNPLDTLYCITNALIKAQQGDFENGLFFCDDDVDILREITTVEKVIEELMPSRRE